MRADGRKNSDIRPMCAVLGELDRADGSGRFEFGEFPCWKCGLELTSSLPFLTIVDHLLSTRLWTAWVCLILLRLLYLLLSCFLHNTGPASALASFTGPIEVRIRDERVDRATLEVIHRPLDGIGATPSRALEDALRASFEPLLTLHRFPRSLVQLVVQNMTPGAAPTTSPPSWSEDKVVSWPPSTPAPASFASAPIGPSGGMAPRAAAFNAASLAALHAGSVGMRAVPLAIAVALLDGEFVLDPSAEEEALATARFGFGWAFGAGVAAAADRMDEEEEEEAESVWTEAEGAFTRQQVCLEKVEGC